MTIGAFGIEKIGEVHPMGTPGGLAEVGVLPGEGDHGSILGWAVDRAGEGVDAFTTWASAIQERRFQDAAAMSMQIGLMAAELAQFEVALQENDEGIPSGRVKLTDIECPDVLEPEMAQVQTEEEKARAFIEANSTVPELAYLAAWLATGRPLTPLHIREALTLNAKGFEVARKEAAQISESNPSLLHLRSQAKEATDSDENIAA